jgi:hypothetical protein
VLVKRPVSGAKKMSQSDERERVMVWKKKGRARRRKDLDTSRIGKEPSIGKVVVEKGSGRGRTSVWKA